MLQIQRQREIIKRLRDDPYLSTKQLALELNVSEMTIRRDFNELASQGAIIREHGGAILPGYETQSASTNNSEERNAGKATKALAKEAVSLVKAGDCIFLDASNSAKVILALLKNLPITVLTNKNLPAEEVKDFIGKIVLLGGTYDAEKAYTYGPVCINNLRSFNLDFCFLSCSAIYLPEYAIFSNDTNNAQIKTYALQQAAKRVLLADSAKFNQKGFYRYGSLGDFDYLISDYPEKELNKITVETKLIYVGE